MTTTLRKADMMDSPDTKLLIDGVAGAGFLSLPIWLHYVQDWLQFLIVVGTFALLLYRIRSAYRDAKKERLARRPSHRAIKSLHHVERPGVSDIIEQEIGE